MNGDENRQDGRQAKADAGPKVFEGASLRKQHKEKKPGNRRWMSLAALVVCAALVAGAVYFAQNITPEAAPEPTSAPYETKMLVDSTRAELVEATVELGAESYTIETLPDGTYGMKGAPNFNLIQTKASSLASSLAYMLYDSAIEAPAELSAYGLDAPKARVTALYKDGTSRTFLLGDQTPTGYRYYLMEQGKPDVYIVYSGAGTNFTVTRAQMHVAQIPQIAVENIYGVMLAQRGKEPIEVGFRPDMQTLGVSSLWLTSPFAYEASSDKVDAYFTNVAGIRLGGFEMDASEEELALYGLDDPRYRLEVTGVDAAGSPVVVLRLYIGNNKDDDSTYARIDETTDVYLLDRASIAFLDGITAANLVDRFANIINITNVDSIRVAQPDGTARQLTIDRAPSMGPDGKQRVDANGKPVFSEAFALGGEPVEDSTFRKLYQIIIGTQVDGMIPEGKVPAEDVKPVLTVTYQLNAVRELETVEYLPYDADHYAVRRNGVCMFYILRARVEMITQALEAYETGTFDPKAFGA